jgi:hypothetical protein
MSLLSAITVFEELKEKYPDWGAFQAFVESEEGGYLRVLPSLQKGEDEPRYRILRYDKNVSRMDIPHVGWFRSVVWDTVLHCPISVAPPKAVPSAHPFSYEGLSLSEVNEKVEKGLLSVEEDRDGFMIQAFCVVGDPTIHLATRSRLDASGTFYSGKTFRTLCLEACGLSTMEGIVEPVQEGGGVVAHFYSFLVQHPEHRVVTPVQAPFAYLIQKGIVSASGRVVLADGFPHTILSVKVAAADPDPSVSGQTLSSWIQTYCQEQPWWFRGVVVKDTTGRRWRFRSEKYKAIQSLRGNESNLYERYARIFTQNLSGVYLEYYPEEMIPFSLCGVFLNDMIQLLHRMYHAIHVRKSSTFSQIHWVYRPHLYAIHGIYLGTLRPSKKWITAQDIRLYLMGQPPARMAFLLRHHQEEYHSRVAQGI